MIQMIVSYPDKPGARFDMGYYRNQHMALSQRIFGEELLEYQIYEGLPGPDGNAGLRVTTVMTFRDANALQEILATRGGEGFADVPNFTDLQPVYALTRLADRVNLAGQTRKVPEPAL